MTTIIQITKIQSDIWETVFVVLALAKGPDRHGWGSKRKLGFIDLQGYTQYLLLNDDKEILLSHQPTHPTAFNLFFVTLTDSVSRLFHTLTMCIMFTVDLCGLIFYPTN